ncbi:MAG: response regulator transcription factor [Bryobacterales bacterium]|nr:response regulator transcription factor [Bryobacterales bacterium]
MRLISPGGTGPMREMPIRVAIIDDDRALLESLSLIIDSADGFRCAGAYTSVEDAVPALRSAAVDVLLLDIQLPGIPGDQAIELLLAANPSMCILMLTVFSGRDRVFTSICSGAHGYLLKSTPPAKLTEPSVPLESVMSPAPVFTSQSAGMFDSTISVTWSVAPG